MPPSAKGGGGRHAGARPRRRPRPTRTLSFFAWRHRYSRHAVVATTRFSFPFRALLPLRPPSRPIPLSPSLSCATVCVRATLPARPLQRDHAPSTLSLAHHAAPTRAPSPLLYSRIADRGSNRQEQQRYSQFSIFSFSLWEAVCSAPRFLSPPLPPASQRSARAVASACASLPPFPASRVAS